MEVGDTWAAMAIAAGLVEEAREINNDDRKVMAFGQWAFAAAEEPPAVS